MPFLVPRNVEVGPLGGSRGPWRDSSAWRGFAFGTDLGYVTVTKVKSVPGLDEKTVR